MAAAPGHAPAGRSAPVGAPAGGGVPDGWLRTRLRARLRRRRTVDLLIVAGLVAWSLAGSRWGDAPTSHSSWAYVFGVLLPLPLLSRRRHPLPVLLAVPTTAWPLHCCSPALRWGRSCWGCTSGPAARTWPRCWSGPTRPNGTVTSGRSRRPPRSAPADRPGDARHRRPQRGRDGGAQRRRGRHRAPRPQCRARSQPAGVRHRPGALGEMHRLLGVLRDGDPDELALQPTLAQLGDLLTRVRAAGLHVELVEVGTRPTLPPSTELAAYRLVQESLTNIVKHGREVTHITVSLRYRAAGVDLTVDDDGRPHHRLVVTEPAGHGLVGMRERLTAVNGTLDAGPRADGGWRVSAGLPSTSAVLPPISCPRHRRSDQSREHPGGVRRRPGVAAPGLPHGAVRPGRPRGRGRSRRRDGSPAPGPFAAARARRQRPRRRL